MKRDREIDLGGGGLKEEGANRGNHRETRGREGWVGRRVIERGVAMKESQRGGGGGRERERKGVQKEGETDQVNEERQEEGEEAEKEKVKVGDNENQRET